MNSLTSKLNLLLLGLAGLVLIINPAITLNFDDIFLVPKVLWAYAVLLPTALILLWGFRKQWLTLKHPVVFTALALLAWMMLSVIMHGGGWLAWWGPLDRADGVFMHSLYVLLLLCGVLIAGQRSLLKQAQQGITIIGLLLALSSLAQQLHLWGVPGEGNSQGVAATLAGGTLGHRGYMGGALALILPVVVSSANPGPLSKVVIVLMTWALVGTDTRGVWLAGAVGIFSLPLWMRHYLARTTWVALIIGLLFSVLTTLIFSNSSRLADPHLQIEPLQIVQNNGRTVLWKSALYGILKEPIFGKPPPALWNSIAERSPRAVLNELGGVDLKSYEVVPRDYFSPPAFKASRWNLKHRIIQISFTKVHNEYLDYALTYGLPGAIIFTFLLYQAIRDRDGNPALHAAVLAYAVYLFTWPEVIRFAPLAWFMLGMSIGHVKIEEVE